MSAFDRYFLMSEADVPAYVQEKISYFESGASLVCKEIGDGNLNYVFRVKDQATGKSIIVKQAGEHLRISEEMTLNTDRGRIESNILRLQEALCPGQVPKVYLYDEIMCAMIMEDMIGHTMMRTGLIRHETYPAFAEQISSFLANSLLMTSDIVMDHQEKKGLVKAFTNPELCQITEDLVLGEPILDYNKQNDIFPPVKDFVEKEIYGDEKLRARVAELKFSFMNNAQALIHGDLHTGSIFINQEHTFVFDPEFAFYGPMGYDIGNVLANLFFAFANGNATIADPTERASFCGWCMCTIMEVVDLFKEKFSKLYDEKCSEPVAKNEVFKESYLDGILADTAGYAGTECLRRIIGIAHNKDITVIGDPEKRAAAEKIILSFGKNLILNREELKTGGDYYTAMCKAIHQIEPDNAVIGPEKTILDYDTVNLNDYMNALVIIDQTKLPGKIELLYLTKQEEIREAIYLLKVRGAPAIGVAAAIGIYLAAREISLKTEDFEEFYREYRKASDYLNAARPTAVNLSWALKRMEGIVKANRGIEVRHIVQRLHDEALAIRDEDISVCRAIGRNGLALVKPGDGLLTHCNAGQLATVKYGTATAPMYLGHEQGYNFRIYCDETRPLLQGARLTSFELSSAGMDVTLLCDNMSASLMREGKIDAVFVGCDRVAANGDAANKIGTSMAALAAKRYGIPFYVCAPTSTIDMSIPTGEGIVIEQRKPEEVKEMWYEKPMAPEEVAVYNPSFDVTDADLITGIVTEFGVAYPPYEKSLQELFTKKDIKVAVEEIIKKMGYWDLC